MIRDKATLKTFFETGDYPTQEQFADLIESLAHVESRKITVSELPPSGVPLDGEEWVVYTPLT